MSAGNEVAVVTGAASGIGRALVNVLVDRGVTVEAADVDAVGLDRLRAECGSALVTTEVCDVSDRDSVRAFATGVASRCAARDVMYLFNNAGIAAGHSFVTDAEGEWERTFSVCWDGVYNCTREFLPLLRTSTSAHLVNVSSVNGFWAWLGSGQPHTAYSSAKFAVKGFTESLIEDFRLHAPNVRVHLVMPGHIRTNITANSALAAGRVLGLPEASIAGLSSEEAAQRIVAAVDAGQWRILVGDDAEALDFIVRTDPGSVYDDDELSIGRRLVRIGGSFVRSLPALVRAREAQTR